MMIYSGDKFPWWRGSAFVGGMVGKQLCRVTLAGTKAISQETLLSDVVGRIRDVRQGPDGYIYLALEDTESVLTEIVRLEPVAGEVALPSR
jgi:glucose/arabinose dehydrogenase